VILFELGLLFWPARLSVMYPEPSPLPLLHPISVAALAFHLAALASVPLLARRRPLVSFGIFWFYATLLPVAQIIPLQNLIADRYLILPVGGVILALVGSLPASGTRLGSLALRWLAILALALSWRSVDRSLDWRSSVSLWSEALRVNPRLGGVAGTLAEALVEEGRLDEAEAVLLEGLRWYPDDPILLQSLGWVYMKAGRPAEAEGTWRRCLARDPERRKAANNLAVLLIKLGRAEEAVPLASGLVARNPRYADAYNTLGAALLESGRLAEARETLLQAVAMSPYTARPVCNLGSALSLAGETAEAERWWRRCLELNPSSEIARKGLAGPRSMEE
jgi:Flp pilus assembly protein TadD